jgi:sugar phosphate isomerase/epimerase
MNRRDFLTKIAGGAAVASRFGTKNTIPLLALQPGDTSTTYPADKRSRVSISTWSFHNYFPSTREKEFNLPVKTLALLDFPGMIADKYNVHNLEFCAPHLASTEQSYLQELKDRLAKAQSRIVNIPVDIDEISTKGGLSDPDNKVRENAIKGSKKWIDIAEVLGCPSVRCDPGKLDRKNPHLTVDSFKQLSAYAKLKKVRVIIENHMGVGMEHPEDLLMLFNKVGGEQVGALPDFGNWPDEATREKGLKMLFPHAHVVCHAKGLEFDAGGNETKFNFAKCVEISKQAGYKGVYSVEYEGPGDPYDGVQKVVNELEKYL